MRNIRIDLLRALGLFMIILAHVNPPGILLQLRNFDVPLMVLISGMSFGLSYREESYEAYVWKRIKRLVFPVWLFLSAYFAVDSIFALNSIDHSMHSISRTFLLINGIGYVWIIKVFILVALAAPFIYIYNERVRSTPAYLLTLLGCFVMYEIARLATADFFATEIGKFIALFSHYAIPYALVFALGLRMPRMSGGEILLCGGLFAAAFLAMAGIFYRTAGEFVPTQIQKYPPGAYYFSYALAVSAVLWLLSAPVAQWVDRSTVLHRFRLTPAVLFVAQNSIWIYLWHIPFVEILQLHYAVKYCVVVAFACSITWVQVWLVNNLMIKRAARPSVQRNLKMILTG